MIALAVNLLELVGVKQMLLVGWQVESLKANTKINCECTVQMVKRLCSEHAQELQGRGRDVLMGFVVSAHKHS